MGSAVSPVVAELFMANIKERALSTSPVAPCWWRGCVDDSNVCLRRTDADLFHQHFNSTDGNIKFTIEHVC